MTLFLVLPAFNEAEALPPLLDKVVECRGDWNAPARVIVVDDGSSDDTAGVCRKHPLFAEGALEVVVHEQNQGLAAAMRTGIEAFLDHSAPGDIMATMDSDNTHDPAYIAVLIDRINKGAGVAICSRFVAGGVERGVSAPRKILSRGARLFTGIIAPVPGVRDIACGYRCYSRLALDRAYRTFGAHMILSSGGSVQAELLVRLMALDFKVEEIPFTLRYDLKPGPSKLGMAKTIRGYFDLRQYQKVSRMDRQVIGPEPEKTPDASKVLVMTCTYNEVENIEPLVRQVLKLLPDASMLVVDDSSPDGTGEKVLELKKEYPNLNLLSRPGKLGLGTAITAGFNWGREQGFELVINMDADFSHDPVSLPQFIKMSEGADYVIGARYVKGGCTLNWGLHRRILSRMGNTFARYMLSAPVHDLTTGYRLIRVSKMDVFSLDTISAKGYGYLIAMTFRAIQANLRIKEVPIRFLDRQRGASKMSANIIQEAFQLVVKLRKERKKG